MTAEFGAKTSARSAHARYANWQSSAESAIARNTWEQAPMRKRFLLLRGGIFEAGRRLMTDSESQPSTGGVPPGLPGAGWVLAAFLVFAAVVFTGWAEGWWAHNSSAAAPAPSHHTTTGSANTSGSSAR